MTAATKPSVMHLIEDETMVFPVRGKATPFRLRVWRAKDCPAAVIVSQAEGGPDPISATCRLANFVLGTLLRFLPAGMDYFEVNGDEVFLVTFDAIGADHRVTLVKPKRVQVYPDEIDALIGTHVEL